MKHNQILTNKVKKMCFSEKNYIKKMTCFKNYVIVVKCGII